MFANFEKPVSIDMRKLNISPDEIEVSAVMLL